MTTIDFEAIRETVESLQPILDSRRPGEFTSDEAAAIWKISKRSAETRLKKMQLDGLVAIRVGCSEENNHPKNYYTKIGPKPVKRRRKQ